MIWITVRGQSVLKGLFSCQGKNIKMEFIIYYYFVIVEKALNVNVTKQY